MMITDITDNKTDIKGDIKYRTLINYPHIECGGKAEARINRFISDIVKNYKANTKKAPAFTYNRLKYRVCCKDPLSLFFESESRGEGLFSYTPFSVTFSDTGYAVPLCIGKPDLRLAKRFFNGSGVRVSIKNMKYSYYTGNNGDTVIYAKNSDKGRAKRSVAEYRVSSETYRVK